MKRFVFAFFISVSFISVYSFPVDTVRINRAFNAMVESGYTAETQREFFDAFPKTWNEYWLTYGSIPSFNNLQDRFIHHMNDGLWKLDKVPDSLFYDRLISLGTAGTVEQNCAGALLQDLILRHIQKNPQMIMERLSKRYYTNYFPFWYFVFNSLICHSPFVDIYKTINNPEMGFVEKYPTIVSYMGQAFAVSCGKGRYVENSFLSYYETHKEGWPPRTKMKIQREDGVYRVVEQMPEYPGGASKMIEFIKENFKLPASYNGKKVFVVVDVVIDENGKVVSPTINKGYDEVAEKEAFRVISKMPRWKAGIQKGKNVPVQFTIPFSYYVKN